MTRRNTISPSADYNEAIRLDPSNSVAYSNRGGIWNLKKDFEKAIADFNEAIRLAPQKCLGIPRKCLGLVA